MAVVQLHGCRAGWPHREQARSHRGSGLNMGFVSTGDRVWERACSRWRWFICMDVGLAGLIASKLAPIGVLGCTWVSCPLEIECGSELARDSGGSSAWMSGWLASSRASSLPQGGWVEHGVRVHWRSSVGASLLAMAVVQLHGCLFLTPHVRRSGIPHLQSRPITNPIRSSTSYALLDRHSPSLETSRKESHPP